VGGDERLRRDDDRGAAVGDLRRVARVTVPNLRSK